jgi:hydrogenase expression/formation protein HypD
MLRVPGSESSLQQAKSMGAKIQTVYSPLDAVTVAFSKPDVRVVFFAVGFETTLPATAIAILQAARKALSNFFVLLSHVRVAPAMQYILEQQDCRIDGFLAAGHVCTVMGTEECESLALSFKVPIVVTGFEPLDLLVGIEQCVSLLESRQFSVANLYDRVVTDQGNVEAQTLMSTVFEVHDQAWRGLGNVRNGGYRLRNEYRSFDAGQLLAETSAFGSQNGTLSQERNVRPVCPSGDVLVGKIKPTECPHFGCRCTPQSPLGAPMVSSEGACAAYYRYARYDLADSATFDAEE